MKYRKKPVVIEAEQWFKNGDHSLDYSKDHQGFEAGELVTIPAAVRKERQWEGDIVRYFRDPSVPGTTSCEVCGQTAHVHGWIDTLEGGHRVCPGDWIITGVNGERYPIKSGLFYKTYDPVEE